MHAIVYLSAWSKSGNLKSMLKTNQIAGLVAGIAMLIIAVSTVPFVYRRYYEGELVQKKKKKRQKRKLCLLLLPLITVQKD